MRKSSVIVLGVAGVLAVAALVPVLGSKQQVGAPGVVPGPNLVHVVGPTPLPIAGTVGAQQAGTWSVTAQQDGTWVVRLSEAAPVATPRFIRQGGCYVMLPDTAGTSSPVYRVAAVEQGWAHIEPVKTAPGTLRAGWLNLARLAYAAEAPCS
jgi:hypothetical protein